MAARRFLLLLIVCLLAVSSAAPLHAQCVTLTASTYSQDFNTLAMTGTSSTVPSGWAFVESGTNANTTYNTGTGSLNTGDTYSFGISNTSPERAFGGLRSGTLVPTIGACFTNNTGASLSSVSVSYTGEQWRLGTIGGRTDRIDFQVSSDATSLTTGTWIDVNLLDFTTPNTAGAAGARDGNAVANRTAITNNVTGLAVANGSSFWIRWSDFDATGADDGLSVDDFSITPGAVPVTPNLTINNVSLAEGNAGTTTFTFTVSLSSPAGAGGVTFDIGTADNTATIANSDYVAKSLAAQSIPAGNSTYTFDVVVNGDTTTEPNETFFVNVTSVTGANIADGQGLGTISNDDVTLTKIHDIQGSGATSPLVGASVTTTGIVYAVRNNGFFMQEPDAGWDANAATSEGIFVFTSAAPPAAAAVGNLVQVTGTVAEFIPASSPNSLPVTELTFVTVVQLSAGQPLPTPFVLTTVFPAVDGPIDQLEPLEGMRVSVPSMTVVAPTDGNVNEVSATATTDGIFYGVVTGTPRPFREPGIELGSAPLPPGSPCCVPRFDGNSEKIRVDSDLLGAPALNVATGATISNVIGPLDYAFGDYSIYIEPTAGAVAAGGMTAVAVSTPMLTEFTVATMNVERLYDDVNDPAIGEPVVNTTAYNNRLGKLSLAIRDYMKTPDVIGMVEVENLTTLQALAARVNTDAVAAGQPNPQYQAFLIEGNDPGGIDVGFLVKTAPVVGAIPRITVNAVVQEGAGATYINPNTGLPETLFDRPPLRLDAVVNYADGTTYPVTVVVNHIRSLNGIDEETPAGSADGPRVRAKRRAQAEFLANLVQTRQTANPAEHIILVGDFNAFEFNDGYVDVIGTILGQPTPSSNVVLASSDLVNPDLTDLFLNMPANERYTYNYEGNAQVLDHVIVNAALISSTTAQRVEGARVNVDFPETRRGIFTSPERYSDHDPVVAFFNVASVVNQPPVNSVPFGQVTNEDTPLVFSTANGNAISVSDPDAAVAPIQVTLSVGNGTLTLSQTTGLTFTVGDGTGDATMTFTGTQTAINAALQGLIYTPALNFAGNDLLTITTNDLGNTGLGGPQSDTDTVGIFVVAVNDAPVNSVPAPQSVSENGTLSFCAATGNAITVSDVDEPVIIPAGAQRIRGAAATQLVEVTLTATNGTFTLSTTNGLTFTAGDGTADTTMTFQGTINDVNIALACATFTPTAGFDGAASLQIVTNDLGNYGSGTPLTDSDTISIGVVNVPLISVNDPSVVEGDGGTVNLTFTISLDAPTTQSVTVAYATQDQTATSADYVTTTGTATFAPSQTTFTVDVPVIGDLVTEGNETLLLNLSTPTGATIADAQGVGTIVDNEGAPTLVINDVTIVEGNAGSTNAIFTVTLTGSTAQTVTVAYTTADVTATAGSDYTTTTGTLTFTPGVTTQQIFVPILGDTTNEPNETFNVVLSGATNAAISDNTGVGTITNDDAIVDLAISKTAGTGPFVAGGPINYTITVSNLSGTVSASGVVVTDVLPAGSTFSSATPSQGSCSGTTTVTCNLGALTAGSSATVMLVINAPGTPGAVANTATASATEIDPVLTNNTSTATVTTLAPGAIPTMSEWALMLLGAMLAAIAAMRLRL